MTDSSGRKTVVPIRAQVFVRLIRQAFFARRMALEPCGRGVTVELSNLGVAPFTAGASESLFTPFDDRPYLRKVWFTQVRRWLCTCPWTLLHLELPQSCSLFEGWHVALLLSTRSPISLVDSTAWT